MNFAELFMWVKIMQKMIGGMTASTKTLPVTNGYYCVYVHQSIERLFMNAKLNDSLRHVNKYEANCKGRQLSVVRKIEQREKRKTQAEN